MNGAVREDGHTPGWAILVTVRALESISGRVVDSTASSTAAAEVLWGQQLALDCCHVAAAEGGLTFLTAAEVEAAGWRVEAPGGVCSWAAGAR